MACDFVVRRKKGEEEVSPPFLGWSSHWGDVSMGVSALAAPSDLRWGNNATNPPVAAWRDKTRWHISGLHERVFLIPGGESLCPQRIRQENIL